jgi:hypothetical protein
MRIVAALVLVVAVALPGCSASSCPYGNRGNGGFCAGRGRASAHEYSGWHTASVRARLPVAARAGRSVVQVTLNQYGEIWAYSGQHQHVVVDVDGHAIKPKEDESADGDDDMPFAFAAFRPNAMDHAMEYIGPRAPGYDFISGELYRSDFGRDKGLRWHIEMYSEKAKAERIFLAAPDGRVMCEHIVTGDATEYVRVSGNGCPDRGF